MDAQKQYITKERKVELEKDLDYLTTVKRTQIAQELQSAKELGDLKENAEYHQAREDQGILEEKIRVIQYTLKEAEIITSGHKTEVSIGAQVTISKKGSSVKTEYLVVGTDEANPTEGKLSYDSPLVSAMMGKKEGDFFSFNTPSGDSVEYKVVAIK